MRCLPGLGRRERPFPRRSLGFRPFHFPVRLKQRPDWNEITTEDPDLSVYDQALEPKSDEDDDSNGADALV